MTELKNNSHSQKCLVPKANIAKSDIELKITKKWKHMNHNEETYQSTKTDTKL